MTARTNWVALASAVIGMIATLSVTRLQPENHGPYSAPIGTVSTGDPQILAYADAIGDSSVDQQPGPYLHASYEEWTRWDEDLVIAVSVSRWTTPDGGGAQLVRRQPGVPATGFTERTIQANDYNQITPEASAVQDWASNSAWQPVCAAHQTLQPQMAIASNNLVNGTESLFGFVTTTYTRVRLNRLCRSNILYALAFQAGTHYLGPVLDPRGRPGVGIEVYSEATHDVLIFDRDSGVLLASVAQWCQAGRLSGLQQATIIDNIAVTASIADPTAAAAFQPAPNSPGDASVAHPVQPTPRPETS
jgi:hypothetical protein